MEGAQASEETLGHALIPIINKLQDIFAQVRGREGRLGRGFLRTFPNSTWQVAAAWKEFIFEKCSCRVFTSHASPHPSFCPR